MAFYRMALLNPREQMFSSLFKPNLTGFAGIITKEQDNQCRQESSDCMSPAEKICAKCTIKPNRIF